MCVDSHSEVMPGFWADCHHQYGLFWLEWQTFPQRTQKVADVRWLCSQASTSHIILFYFAFRCLMTLILVTITFPPFTCHKEGSLMRRGTTFVLHLFHCHKTSIPEFLCVAGSVHKDLLPKWHHNCIPKHPLRHFVIVVDPL